MYDREFYPFYVTYANPLLFAGERMQEEEFNRMKSYYPETAGRIQEKVEAKCDLLDYEGSRIYDEYPDRLMLNRLSGEIRRELEPAAEMEAMSRDLLDDLIQVLLFQEISRRRCRRNRCRRWY